MAVWESTQIAYILPVHLLETSACSPFSRSYFGNAVLATIITFCCVISTDLCVSFQCPTTIITLFFEFLQFADIVSYADLERKETPFKPRKSKLFGPQFVNIITLELRHVLTVLQPDCQTDGQETARGHEDIASFTIGSKL